MSKLATIVRVPFTVETMTLAAELLKSEGYAIGNGLSTYVATRATQAAFTKGSSLYGALTKGQTFKYLSKPERPLFYACWNGTEAPKRTTASEARKASGKSGKAPVKPADWNDMQARAEYLRACKAYKSGKAPQASGKSAPQATTPQASGKLTDAEKLAAVGEALAAVAALLAS